jgi:hypothetical protein
MTEEAKKETEEKVECRHPRPGEFFQVHPSPDMRRDETLAFENGKYYLIAPHLVDDLKRVVHPDQKHKLIDVTLFTAINNKHETFLWPVPRPVPTNHPAFVAMGTWIKIEKMGDETIH